MDIRGKAERIRLADFSSAPMRAFHMAWLAFFLCFFSWFGVAPLMPVIRQELHLTKAQTGNSIIASVVLAVFGRLVIGWLCDRIGPRKTHSALLIAGAIPVMTIGLAHDYSTFLMFRLAIGMIGASFVVTQYHTSVMFAPDVVGTANATAAGWGNLGGGVTQLTMPLLFSAFLSLGVGPWWGWRLAMFIPGLAMLVCGVAYYLLTQDTPEGNLTDLRAAGRLERTSGGAGFAAVVRDPRVWALFVLYGCSFGMELTIDNIAALYFADSFHLALTTAGFVAASFGMMNVFARALGGIVSDGCNRRWGLRGRVWLLGCTILGEGLGLILFSRMRLLPLAIASMMLAGLFVKMSNGASYAIVPFINRRGLGAVAGIVGAGGNVGAVLMGFLFKSANFSWPQALLILGCLVTLCSSLVVLVRFSRAEERGSGFVKMAALPVSGD
jgi:NNP family nitrate/nitrite transporter-like MFS transporter